MPIDLEILIRQIIPEDTILFMGAGSSIPSGGPTGKELALSIAKKFGISDAEGLDLCEVSTIVERRYSRRDLVYFLRDLIGKLSPAGSIYNLPYYDWRAIFTTNYDTLIEQVYDNKKKEYNLIK